MFVYGYMLRLNPVRLPQCASASAVRVLSVTDYIGERQTEWLNWSWVDVMESRQIETIQYSISIKYMKK